MTAGTERGVGAKFLAGAGSLAGTAGGRGLRVAVIAAACLVCAAGADCGVAFDAGGVPPAVNICQNGLCARDAAPGDRGAPAGSGTRLELEENLWIDMTSGAVQSARQRG